MLVRENFDGPCVWRNGRVRPQDAQTGQTSHPPTPARQDTPFRGQGRSK